MASSVSTWPNLMKRALFIDHDHVTNGGLIQRQFEARGYEVTKFLVVPEASYNVPNVVATFPDFSNFDVIVPMGAPWGVWEDGRIGNWLLPELKWLKNVHNAGIPIFGICFGGQLMARALGGSVARGPKAEVGWYPLMSDDQSIIPNGPWFQYHWDRWVTPKGATEIARTPIASQAFIMGRTLGLQFHPEVNIDVLNSWLSLESGCVEVEGEGLNLEVLRAQTIAEEPSATIRAINLVNYFLESIASADIKPV